MIGQQSQRSPPRHAAIRLRGAGRGHRCLAPAGGALCGIGVPAGALGAIQETPAQISELSQVLASGDLGNQILVFVRGLHSRHPDAPTGELVNYLVTAYCPVVNSLTGLSDGEKQGRMDAFITQVTVAAH
jgi:hypothetical protein